MPKVSLSARLSSLAITRKQDLWLSLWKIVGNIYAEDFVPGIIMFTKSYIDMGICWLGSGRSVFTYAEMTVLEISRGIKRLLEASGGISRASHNALLIN